MRLRMDICLVNARNSGLCRNSVELHIIRKKSCVVMAWLFLFGEREVMCVLEISGIDDLDML